MDQFVVYELQSALLNDASTLVHPMTNPVERPEEISDIFDYVTYGKCTYYIHKDLIFNAFKIVVLFEKIFTENNHYIICCSI